MTHWYIFSRFHSIRENFLQRLLKKRKEKESSALYSTKYMCVYLLKDILPTRSSIKRISPKRIANSPLSCGNPISEHWSPQLNCHTIISKFCGKKKTFLLTWTRGWQRRQWGEILCVNLSTSKRDRETRGPVPARRWLKSSIFVIIDLLKEKITMMLGSGLDE